MLNELTRGSKKAGLEITITKIMSNREEQDVFAENVKFFLSMLKKYIYFGQSVSFEDRIGK